MGEVVVRYMVKPGRVGTRKAPVLARGPSSSVQRWARATREPGSSGLATRHFEGIKGQHGGRRVVYRTQDKS